MSKDKSSLKEVEDLTVRRSEDLCKLAEMIGYGDRWGQLQNPNGSFVSSLLAFFDDNPGAMEAVHSWVVENADAFELPEDEEEDEEFEEDEEGTDEE